MNNYILYGILGLLVGVLIGLFVIPSAGWSQQGYFGMMRGNMGWQDDARFRGERFDAIDEHFIEQMIPHHEDAILMAELALERSERPEIRSLAEGIIEAQTREIEDMRGWYQEWFGEVVPEYTGYGMGMMGRGHMMNVEGDLGRLEGADDFDLEFIRQMVPHHQMGVMMAQMLLVGTEREEMRTLADQIITSQSREIDMMRNWYQEWATGSN